MIVVALLTTSAHPARDIRHQPAERHHYDLCYAFAINITNTRIGLHKPTPSRSHTVNSQPNAFIALIMTNASPSLCDG